MSNDAVTLPTTTDEVALELLNGFIRKHGPTSTAPSVVEAKELRLIVTNWHAMPPSREARATMIARITELVEKGSDSGS